MPKMLEFFENFFHLVLVTKNDDSHATNGIHLHEISVQTIGNKFKP